MGIISNNLVESSRKVIHCNLCTEYSNLRLDCQISSVSEPGLCIRTLLPIRRLYKEKGDMKNFHSHICP